MTRVVFPSAFNTFKALKVACKITCRGARQKQ